MKKYNQIQLNCGFVCIYVECCNFVLLLLLLLLLLANFDYFHFFLSTLSDHASFCLCFCIFFITYTVVACWFWKNAKSFRLPYDTHRERLCFCFVVIFQYSTFPHATNSIVSVICVLLVCKYHLMNYGQLWTLSLSLSLSKAIETIAFYFSR